ncbi:P-loop NTPase [Candidatus Sneabacter namystus]|uniref:ATP-binding protein n=1 Tax=Candidatus Sneabacter namystus TaxID=2601646 RepID=A0A5C0UJ04_9RICK|nr:P-loop NTPase [Candidatus Sneabacter namystus]QEK39432.1 ATP-binding protein [Candidatus Sneabacter namystus]
MLSKQTLSKHTIVVASGKGGVGKSTVASALAQQLAKKGKVVGLIDADIHCSSIATIFGIYDSDTSNKEYQLYCRHGVHILPFGVQENQLVAWRGLLSTKVIKAAISSITWPELDYLIFDMPPGTGDMHLSILSSYKIDSVFVVTTMSKMSVSNALKTYHLYHRCGIQDFVIVQNSLEDTDVVVLDVCTKLLSNISSSETILIRRDTQISTACDFGQCLAEITPDLTSSILK